MFHGFLLFVESKYPNVETQSTVPIDRKIEALEFFGLTVQYEEMLKDRETRAQFKVLFRGANVSQWLGLGTNWRLVSKVMNEVRDTHGGEQGVYDFFGQNGEEALKTAVTKAMRVVRAREKGR
jgi:hypothetical protein